MQQMDPKKAKGEWQASSGYGAYEGEPRYNEYGGLSSQKLNVDDDEQFAEILARKIKQELRDEFAQGGQPSINERLMLGIASLCAVVCLFGLLVLALIMGVSGGATIALGWGIVAIVIVIAIINGYFNSSTTRIEKNRSKSNGNEKEQAGKKKK
jgi:hypothetical protein